MNNTITQATRIWQAMIFQSGGRLVSDKIAIRVISAELAAIAKREITIKQERAVIDAAIEWKQTFGHEGNAVKWEELSRAIDNLIAAREAEDVVFHSNHSMDFGRVAEGGEVEVWKNAYFNMRKFAEDNGLDTRAHYPYRPAEQAALQSEEE